MERRVASSPSDSSKSGSMFYLQKEGLNCDCCASCIQERDWTNHSLTLLFALSIDQGPPPLTLFFFKLVIIMSNVKEDSFTENLENFAYGNYISYYT
jgi:hypothetical protein